MLNRLFSLACNACLVAEVALGCSLMLGRDADAGPLTAAEERRLNPGDRFQECDACPMMVVIPAGSFSMGSPATEEDRKREHLYPNEGPEHQVSFAKRLAVGRFAVTFDQWDACRSSGGCQWITPSDYGWGRGNRPALLGSLSSIYYARWLAELTGKPYRLPTEAEREYFTRAGTTTPFWSGPSISPAQANYDGNFFRDSNGKWAFDPARNMHRAMTMPVDMFEPNPWGLYQVTGNVNEWVEDCYHADYRDAPSDGSAWTAGGGCSLHHVVRGGSWMSPPWFLRSASRRYYMNDGAYMDMGARVVRTLNQ